jgi:hypothetical protein
MFFYLKKSKKYFVKQKLFFARGMVLGATYFFMFFLLYRFCHRGLSSPFLSLFDII